MPTKTDAAIAQLRDRDDALYQQIIEFAGSILGENPGVADLTGAKASFVLDVDAFMAAIEPARW
jgi:hypothetical protein